MSACCRVSPLQGFALWVGHTLGYAALHPGLWCIVLTGLGTMGAVERAMQLLDQPSVIREQALGEWVEFHGGGISVRCWPVDGLGDLLEQLLWRVGSGCFHMENG